MNRIKQVFDERMHEVYFWMKVELMHVKNDRNGHYYLDIVETKDGTVQAKSTAQIWNYTATYLKKELGSDFEQIVKPGSAILCYCKAVFHTIYGLSFVITKLDVNYNLGTLEQQKAATIKQLTVEGLLERNKKTNLVKVPQRIALVASPNTAGYEDFMKQLTENSFGFTYCITTFATKVQGDDAVKEIVQQLQLINEDDFDVIVILRGGGSKFDLEPFNAYELAKTIADSKLPVLTGIGHETDTSVADLTAHTALKTPSAVAAFIVEKAATFNHAVQVLYLEIRRLYDEKVLRVTKDLKHQVTEFTALSSTKTKTARGSLHTLTNRILTLVNEEQAQARTGLTTATQQLALITKKHISLQRSKQQEVTEQLQLYSKFIVRDNRERLPNKIEQLQYLVKMKLKATHSKLNDCEHYPNVYHPNVVLQRGYAILRKEQKIVTTDIVLKPGDAIEIELYDRIFNATITTPTLWKNLPTKEQNKN